MRLFCRIGGRETALSYGITGEAYERLDYTELGSLLQSVVPVEHQSFLTAFEDLIEIGDYAFVHAGVHPGRPLSDQRTTDLRWIRDPFLDHVRPLEKIIVHGHTIADDVEIDGTPDRCRYRRLRHRPTERGRAAGRSVLDAPDRLTQGSKKIRLHRFINYRTILGW